MGLSRVPALTFSTGKAAVNDSRRQSTSSELTDIVQRIEHTEDIQPVLHGLLAEVIDGIVPEQKLATSLGFHNLLTDSLYSQPHWHHGEELGTEY